MIDENDNNQKEPLQEMGSNLGSGINPYEVRPLTWLVTFIVFGTPILLAFIMLGVIPQAIFAPLTKIIEMLS
jgi:hypothetical protein